MAVGGDLASEFLRDAEEDDALEEEPVEELGAEVMDEEMNEDRWYIPDAVQLYIESKSRPKETLAALIETDSFKQFIQRVDEAIDRRKSNMAIDHDNTSIQSDPEVAALLDACNSALLEVDQEILTVYRYIRSIYSKRFPELEAIVPLPLDYIAVATRLQNILDVSVMGSLSEVLPNTTIMAVTVAASISVGSLLSATELQRVVDASDDVNKLVEARKTILLFIEIHLSALAPNLTALTGASLAARLVTHTGSLKQLADMPAQNILNIGGSAFSRATSAFGASVGGNSALPTAARRAGKGYGVIWHSDIVQGAPPERRARAMRLLAGKCGLAARSDVYNATGGDMIGRALRDQIFATLRKLEEPPPPQLKKILPIPDEKPRARRGGKRSRHAKEKYGMSELQRQANRLRFGLDAEGDYGLDDVQPVLGMVGITDSARLKAKAKDVQRVRRPAEKIRKGMLMDLI